MAICGIITLLAVGAAVLLDHFYPVTPQYPKMFKSDESLKSKTVLELIELSPRDKSLPLISLKELENSSGRKGEKAYVACKGIVYDCSANEVYRSDGGYNCFSGKDATIALGKMLFEKSGEAGWKEKLNHEELCVVAEWVSWFN
jgi:predicted heme/steroid binding protein